MLTLGISDFKIKNTGHYEAIGGGVETLGTFPIFLVGKV